MIKDDLQREEEIQINFSEIRKQCENWRKRGYKIMMVYQPITGSSVHSDFYKSMLSVLSGEVWEYMANQHKVILKPYVSPHFPIDANRNMAVIDAQESYQADYMFFMDTDQTFPPLTIPTLFDALAKKQKEESQLCVMAGMYFAKKNPWAGVFGRYSDWDDKTKKFRREYEQLGLIHRGRQLLWWKSVDFWTPGSLFRVDVIGAGCMMMPTGVFKAIGMPFFKYLPDFQKVGKQASEDMWFCAQLKKADIPVWINSNVSCGHISGYLVDEALHVNQRNTFYAHASKETALKTYEKMLDLRTDEEKQKWIDQTIEKRTPEDEHVLTD